LCTTPPITIHPPCTHVSLQLFCTTPPISLQQSLHACDADLAGDAVHPAHDACDHARNDVPGRV